MAKKTIYDRYGTRSRRCDFFEDKKIKKLKEEQDDKKKKNEKPKKIKKERKRMVRRKAGTIVELDKYSTMNEAEFMKDLSKKIDNDICAMLKYDKFDPELYASNKALDESQLAIYKGQMSRVMQPLLYRGFDKETIVQTFGMLFGLYAFSKQFRKQTRNAISTSLRTKKYNKYQREIYDLEDRMDDLEDQRSDGELSDEAYFKERSRLEKIQSHYIYEVDGRMPYSPKTTAQLQMKMLVQSQELIEKYPNETERIIRQYRRSVNNLYQMAGTDGITKEEIARSFNTLAGNMIERDPEAKKYFYEISRLGYSNNNRELANKDNIVGSQFSMVDKDGKILTISDRPLSPNLPNEYYYSRGTDNIARTVKEQAHEKEKQPEKQEEQKQEEQQQKEEDDYEFC